MRILLYILLTFPLFASAQQPCLPSSNYGNTWNRGGFSLGLSVPAFPTQPNVMSMSCNGVTNGQLYLNTTTNTFYFYSNGTWYSTSSGGGGGGTVTSIQFSNGLTTLGANPITSFGTGIVDSTVIPFWQDTNTHQIVTNTYLDSLIALTGTLNQVLTNGRMTNQYMAFGKVNSVYPYGQGRLGINPIDSTPYFVIYDTGRTDSIKMLFDPLNGGGLIRAGSVGFYSQVTATNGISTGNLSTGHTVYMNPNGNGIYFGDGNFDQFLNFGQHLTGFHTINIPTNKTGTDTMACLSDIRAIISGGTVTNVIAGTNISITGTSTIQPTINISGTIQMSNGGTGATTTTSVNGTPITYGANNTLSVGVTTVNVSTPITSTGGTNPTIEFQKIAASSVPANTTTANATPSGSIFYNTKPGPSQLPEFDTNVNLSANAFQSTWTSTVTSAGTVTLTASSSPNQNFTGTNTESIILPVTSTLTISPTYFYYFWNRSTGAISIYSSGGTLLLTMPSGTTSSFNTINTGHTDGTDWGITTTVTQPNLTNNTTASTTAYADIYNGHDSSVAFVGSLTPYSLNPNSGYTVKYEITGATGAITINNQVGNWQNNQELLITYYDNGTARGISYGTHYKAAVSPTAITPATTTVIGQIVSQQWTWNTQFSEFFLTGQVYTTP